MYLLIHESMEHAKESAERLKGMGAAARKLLEQCVEHQGVTRQRVSASAQALEDAGFVRIQDGPSYPMDRSVVILPSLAGEEALQMLELIEEGSAKPEDFPSISQA
jgi:DNA-binding MarR family transcriptional regulator